MLSIIAAVHNQLGHNTLFLEGISRYTTGPYRGQFDELGDRSVPQGGVQL